MTGNLKAYLYVFIDEFECLPISTCQEAGREHFVGSFNGEAGTFRTTYKFEEEYEGYAENDDPPGDEIFGCCRHPMVEGNGTCVFDGVSGRMYMKEDIDAGNIPYIGHLKF